jgi:hypothetical protein
VDTDQPPTCLSRTGARVKSNSKEGGRPGAKGDTEGEEMTIGMNEEWLKAFIVRTVTEMQKENPKISQREFFKQELDLLLNHYLSSCRENTFLYGEYAKRYTAFLNDWAPKEKE